MKLDLAEIWKALRLPLGLTAVVSGVLALFGVSLDQVLVIAASMIGLWTLISVLVNVLKILGVVDDGTAGKWSALLNLLALGVIAYVLAINPTFDFAALDGQFQTFAEFGTLILTYLVNVIGTKAAHVVETKGLGVKAFTQPASHQDKGK